MTEPVVEFPEDLYKELEEKEIQTILNEIRNKTQRELAEIIYQARSTDDKTDLLNKRGFKSVAEALMLVAKREQLPLTLLFFDADNFKRVNDTYGHEVGDQLIIYTGNMLKDNTIFRQSDVKARLHGDEFAVLLTDANLTQAQEKINKFKEKIKTSLNEMSDGDILYDINLNFSIGAVEWDGEMSYQEFFDEADLRMYKVKMESRSDVK